MLWDPLSQACAAEAMLKESVFSCLSPLSRGTLKSRRWWNEFFSLHRVFRNSRSIAENKQLCSWQWKNGATAECVFTDSVLCLGGKCQTHPRSREILGVVEFDPFRELLDIAREPVVFVWRIYPGRTAGQLFPDVQKKMVDENMVHPFHFKGRVIFMSMYNDIDSSQKHNDDFCRKSSSRVSAYAKSFPTVCLTYLGLGYEEKLKGTVS